MYIKTNDDFFPNYYLVKGEQVARFNFGMTSAEITDMFKDNKAAYQQIQNYNKSSNRFNIALWGGAGLALLYLFSNRDSYSRGTYWGIFGTGMVTSLYYAGRSQRAFYKAINIYNEVPEEFSFNKVPKLNYSWRF